MAIATGMRRGEILALRWTDMDARYTVAQITRSLQVSSGELSFQSPKTRRSRRAVVLPEFLRPPHPPAGRQAGQHASTSEAVIGMTYREPRDRRATVP